MPWGEDELVDAGFLVPAEELTELVRSTDRAPQPLPLAGDELDDAIGAGATTGALHRAELTCIDWSGRRVVIPAHRRLDEVLPRKLLKHGLAVY